MILQQKPRLIDVLLLGFFTILITFQPFYLHDDIIMMESGIHLPVINAVFHGLVPYRDVFFLRGPLELYVPALGMLLFGKNAAILPTFYYLGTIATLLLWVFMAAQIFRTRLILYLAIPVLIARTFPRVSFNYWGGMRYAMSLLPLLLFIIFLKRRRFRWVFFSGVISAAALLTTIEAGFCATVSVSFAFVFALVFKIEDRRFLLKGMAIYGFGVLCLLFPSAIYLIWTNSLVPFFDSTHAVIRNLYIAFPDAPGNHPESFVEFLSALWPGSRFFKFMTPIYCYLVFLVFFVYVLRFKKISQERIIALFSLMVYGSILYISAFRKIEGHHFEMALQPEKLLLFFMLEEVFLFFKERISLIKAASAQQGQKSRSWKIVAMYCFIACLILSSVIYSIERYNKRFVMSKVFGRLLAGKPISDLSPLAGRSKMLAIDRAKGMVVPKEQADEITTVVDFISRNTKSTDVVFTPPELGTYNFLFDRPFVGRFAVVTASWLKEDWWQELINDFKEVNPEYAVMTNVDDVSFPSEWYFRNPRNIERYEELTQLVLGRYDVVKSLPSVSIYRLKHSYRLAE